MSKHETNGVPGRRMVMAGAGLGVAGLVAAATTQPAYADRNTKVPVYRVDDYGAVARADEDNSAAFQRAIDAAEGKGSVLIPPGEYGLDHLLSLPAGARIYGYGAILHRMSANVTMAMVNWTPGDTTTGGYDGNGDIGVFGLTWDAHGDTIKTAANTITFAHARNIVCADLTLLRSDGYHAIEYNAVDGGVIERCRFEGFQPIDGNPVTRREAIQIDVAGFGAKDKTMARNISIRDCIFTPYYVDGEKKLDAHATFIGSHSHGDDGDYYYNITVERCYGYGATTRAVGGYYWRGSTVRDCVFMDIAGDAIQAVTCDDVTFADCFVANTKYQAASLANDTRRSRIVGVTAVNTGHPKFDGQGPAVPGWPQEDQQGTGEESFFVGTGSRDNQVSDCVSAYSRGHAVRCETAHRTMLSGNRVVGSAEAPISIYGCDGAPSDRTSVTGTAYDQDSVSPRTSAAIQVEGPVSGTWAFANNFHGLDALSVGGDVSTSPNGI